METLSFENIPVQIQRKAFYRGVKLTVEPSGTVILKASKGLGRGPLLTFLQSREEWLRQALQESRALREKFPQKHFVPGESYIFCGRQYRLKVVDALETFVVFSGQELLFHGPSSLKAEDGLQMLKATYRETGKKLLLERVGVFSQKMALFPQSVGFRGQKSIWGSCSAENKISLNWKLVVAPLWVQDYVVIHELAHIRHKDHSKKFWGLVDEYTPHAKDAKVWLKEHVYAADFLAKTSELWKTPVASS